MGQLMELLTKEDEDVVVSMTGILSSRTRIQIYHLIRHHPEGLTLQEIAAAIAAPKPSTTVHLKTMVAHGIAFQAFAGDSSRFFVDHEKMVEFFRVLGVGEG